MALSFQPLLSQSRTPLSKVFEGEAWVIQDINKAKVYTIINKQKPSSIVRMNALEMVGAEKDSKTTIRKLIDWNSKGFERVFKKKITFQEIQSDHVYLKAAHVTVSAKRVASTFAFAIEDEIWVGEYVGNMLDWNSFIKQLIPGGAEMNNSPKRGVRRGGSP